MSWLAQFYIDFGRPCNSACLYCAVPPHEDAQGFTPLGRVPEMIEAGVAVGCDRAILIGGEPTIYPHLDDVLAMLREAGLARDHIIMTNGLRLAKEGVAQGLFEAGVDTFHISIDTADPPSTTACRAPWENTTYSAAASRPPWRRGRTSTSTPP